MTISRRAFACAAGAGFASLIVPGLPEKYRNSRNAWLETAKIFNQISGKVKLQGMRVDIRQTVHSGADPVARLKQYPGRALTVHGKEWPATKKDALAGDDKWKEAFRACETTGGAEW